MNLIKGFLRPSMVNSAKFNYSTREKMIYSCGIGSYIPNKHMWASHLPEYRAFSSSDCSKKVDFKSKYGDIEKMNYEEYTIMENILFKEHVIWIRSFDANEFYWVADDNSHTGWKLRLNDFPAEPMYTFIVDGNEILNFDDLPDNWFIKEDRYDPKEVKP